MRSLLIPTQITESSAVQISKLRFISEKIDRQVQSILLQVALVPFKSLPECGLLFPLFMAGGDTVNPAHVAEIRMRLQLLRKHRAFQKLERVSEVLEELWILRSCETRRDVSAAADVNENMSQSFGDEPAPFYSSEMAITDTENDSGWIY